MIKGNDYRDTKKQALNGASASSTHRVSALPTVTRVLKYNDVVVVKIVCLLKYPSNKTVDKDVAK